MLFCLECFGYSSAVEASFVALEVEELEILGHVALVSEAKSKVDPGKQSSVADGVKAEEGFRCC